MPNWPEIQIASLLDASVGDDSQRLCSTGVPILSAIHFNLPSFREARQNRAWHKKSPLPLSP
ncbi:MAG: hypothetical protein DWI02_01550 [Planctomycetota bacterium]|nr:MAG: hypothetical protein DWI02_01550 [Planctomycetota bacterium]